MAAVAASHKQFEELDVKVIACSVDSVAVHLAWHDQELSKMVEGGIPYPLASDADGRLGRDYGVYDETLKVNLRGRFLIDPDGIVQSIEVLHDPVGRNIEEWLRQIRAFQHVRASKDPVVTPVGWEPGDQTLQPGAAMVGQVCNVWKKP